MPQAIVSIIGIAGGPLGVGGALIGEVIGVPISGGLIGDLLGIGKSKGQKPSDGQRIIKVNVGSRIRHYGKLRIAGQATFYESKDGNLYILITTGHGQINAITEYQLNAKAVTVNGSGLVTDTKFNGAISIHNRLGTDSQSAYSELTSIFSDWTTNHRQRGCSSVLMIARAVDSEEFSEVYEGNREPEPSITAETSLVYDPRLDSTQVIGVDEEGADVYGSGSHRKNDKSTFAYSDNWALCFADYLAHPDGYGMGYDMINWTNIAEEADICDIEVTTVDARTIRQWRVAGSYKMASDDRRTVVKEFLKAGDGFMWQDANALANIRCGRWIAPTVHIPEKHIIGLTGSLGLPAPDRANEVRVIYMEPRFDYTETEAAPTVDTAAQTALGRPEVSRYDVYYCPDHNQAKRIGKRFLKRLGERWAFTVTTNLYGLNIIGERFITMSVSELSITNVSFEITSIKIDPASLNVQFGLVEVLESDFDFNAASEEGTPPGDVPITGVAITVESVANLSLSSVQLDLNGSNGVGIAATWNANTRVGLITQVQYKKTADSVWIEMPVAQSERLATSGLVSTGVEYGVRARNFTVGGRPSDWSATETITPSATVSAPSTPTSFSATGGTGDADLTWRNPPESNFDHVEVYESATDDFGTATQTGSDIPGGLNALMAETITLAAGTHYLWLVAYSDTGLASAETASQSVTVS